MMGNETFLDIQPVRSPHSNSKAISWVNGVVKLLLPSGTELRRHQSKQSK